MDKSDLQESGNNKISITHNVSMPKHEQFTDHIHPETDNIGRSNKIIIRDLNSAHAR